MAEDVEVMSVQEAGEDDEEEERPSSGQDNQQASSGQDSGPVSGRELSTSSDITSSNSASNSRHDSVSNVDCQAPDLVSSISDVYNGGVESDQDQLCDCSSSSSRPTPGNSGLASENLHSDVGASSSHGRCSQSDCKPDKRYNQTTLQDSGCPSDTESEIVVDDSPSFTCNSVNRIGSSNDNGAEEGLEIIAEDCDNGSCGYLRPLGRSRSVTPSPSYIRLATPSTPGTPRLRSGSVSGTTYAPTSPRPSTRGTPAERQRSGSMGEIEMKERALGRVRIIDGLDILQLPRPRNPGGILPLNGHDNFNSSNEALNLIVDNKQRTNKPQDPLTVPRQFSSFHSIDTAVTSSKQSNTSYLISNIIRSVPSGNKPATVSSFNSNTSHRAGCSINESVERPKPSSEVDSEGVAKKIARLNSGGFLCSSSSENLWNGAQSNNLRSSHNHLSAIRVLSDKTPPERPKPPRRTVLSPADNGDSDLVADRFVSSSVRRRLSPSQLSISRHQEINGDNGYEIEGEVEICTLPHHYKCRMCNFSATNYNQLQMHTSKHGGGSKTFKCSLCDYTTVEKTNFRRHRRLHHKSSPVNMLKCIKCSFSTSLPRKLREHYQHVHPDLPASTLLPGLTSGGNLSPPPFIGAHNMATDLSGGYQAQYYDNPLLINRSDRLGFPYTMTGRHPALNMPFDQYNVPYEAMRDRQGESLTSNYLRSIVTSMVTSEPSTRQAAATSTVTSSNYLVPSGAENSNPIHNIHTCTNQGSCTQTCNVPHTGIKIKVEADLDNTSDVSSCNRVTPDVNLNDAAGHGDTPATGLVLSGQNQIDSSVTGPTLRRHRSEDATSSNIHDAPTDLSSPRKQRTVSDIHHISSRINIDGIDLENGSDSHVNSVQSGNIISVSDTVVKSDSTTRGIQCVLPIIKTEIDLDGDYYDFCRRPRFMGIDRAVQCNLNSSAANTRSQNLPSSRMTYRSQSASESDQSEPHSLNMDSRCEYCGITFEDEVIFSIHIGCHSHTDPFKCNVCGKQCGNKYGFYSHIMRGHQI